eukprot:6188128-Pleurochrysis_carterae.AAC.2
MLQPFTVAGTIHRSSSLPSSHSCVSQISCFQPEAGAAKQTTGGGKVLPWYTSRGHSVCLFHARETKRKRPIASLAVSAAEHAFLQREVDEFALTGHGLYVAPASAAERTRLPSRVSSEPSRLQPSSGTRA